MNIANNPSFLLFIEPKESPSNVPIIDEYTKKIAGAMKKARFGASAYSQEKAEFCENLQFKGWHSCSCNKAGDNRDYIIETSDVNTSVKVFTSTKDFFQGTENYSKEQVIITNALALHYVAFHRQEVSEEELKKITLLTAEPCEPTFE